MKARAAFCLGLVLACLVAPGCTGLGRPPVTPGAERPAPESEEDREHAKLERELSLYSD